MKSIVILLIALLILQSAVSKKAPYKYSEHDQMKLDEARKLQSELDAVSAEGTTHINNLEVASHKKMITAVAERNEHLAKIKGFWGEVLKAHAHSEMWLNMCEDDQKVIPYIRSIAVTEIDANDGTENSFTHFKVVLALNSNPYISNTVLWREVRGSLGFDDTASGVNWFKGKGPTDGPSFFSYFLKFDGDVTPDSPTRLHEHTINEISHVIRYELWPTPFTYYDHSHGVYPHHGTELYDPSIDPEGWKKELEQQSNSPSASLEEDSEDPAMKAMSENVGPASQDEAENDAQQQREDDAVDATADELPDPEKEM